MSSSLGSRLLVHWCGLEGVYRGVSKTLESTPRSSSPPPFIFWSQFLPWDIGGRIGEAKKHLCDAPNFL
jgi:hypothetical protein